MSQEKKEQKKRAEAKESPSTSSSAGTRLHLRVVQDDSGRESLALNAALFEHSWQNNAANDAANAAFALLREAISLEQVLSLAEKMVAEASRLTDKFYDQAGGLIECEAGCAHCCHQVVGCTPPEALQIYFFLQENWSEEQLNALRDKLRQRCEVIRGLSMNERYSPEHPCPLLKEGSCSVYPVRPLACRGMNSADRADCESRLHDPVRREEFLRTGQGGRVLLDPLRATQAISAGVQLALSEQFHLDMPHLDLTQALDLLFTRGQQVTDEWLAGEETFQGGG